MKKTVIVDERIPSSCLEGLKGLGFSCITLPPSRSLPTPLASHTDILMFRHGTTIISSAEYMKESPSVLQKIKEALPHFDIRLTCEHFGKDYPRDAIFNALVIGDRIFCKTDSVCREILAYADEVGLKAVGVKQGYPACTALAISDTHAITSDEGMAKALRGEGIKVLKVPECDKITLPPYKNGFIGGAAGRLGKNIYFAGSPTHLPYFSEMADFAEQAGVNIISLSDEAFGLIDLGGLAFCE